MNDSLLQKFAQALMHYSLEVGEGDVLLIRSTTLGIPLVREVYKVAMESGANVIPRLTFDGYEDLFLGCSTNDQLAWINPADITDSKCITHRLTIQAPFNTRSSQSLSPERHRIRSNALAEIAAIGAVRSAAGEMKWCGTLFPTHALAQEADMSLSDYENFVYRAMFLYRDDPITAWREFSLDQQQKVDYLNRVRTIRFLADGTDLSFLVAERKWMNSDGKRNFPSGEVFTSPIETTVNGTYRSKFPSLRNGCEIEDVTLTFKDGKVTEAYAVRGEDTLMRELEVDPGSRFLGEVAIGNNYGISRYTCNTLFDEKIGGTVHIALGSSYAETGGKNCSAIHWDLVCDLRNGGEIIADGEVIHRSGQWLI